MRSLGLDDIDAFPFLDPPSPKAVADGYALLLELGAMDEQRRLTRVGKQLARLPVDPAHRAHAAGRRTSSTASPK